MGLETFIHIENVSKTFPGVKALQNISLDVRLGEVHALIGENGAGKSTLIKILSGAYQPDEGAVIDIEGKTYSHLTPSLSMQHGIMVIYQDFSLFPNLSVKENIAFSEQIEKKRRFISWNEIEAVAAKALSELGVSIDLNAKLGSLSTAKQQLVAIARALVFEAKLVIMDEPTSALSKGEVEILFEIVNRLRSRNIGIIFISHKLDELFTIADRMTVIRDGQYIGTADAKDISTGELITMMVGREISFERLGGKDFGAEILAVHDISKKGNFSHVSFSLRAGEILGITGLVGAGRTELVRALFGLNAPESGSITLEGRNIMPKTPHDAIKHGIAYVPENRQTEGLVLAQEAGANVTLSILSKLVNSLHVIKTEKRRALALELMEKLNVKPLYPNMQTGKFSGGNQQKMVIAKWLSTNPKVLIIDEPTNGIDVGAKSEIHKLMRRLADDGMGIIMVSSELPEVLSISDRVLVMRRGRIAGEFNGATATQEEIMNKAVLGMGRKP